MTPDGWIRWYYTTLDDAGAPGLDIVESRGRVYKKRCAVCPSRTKHSTKDGGYKCGRCGADWPFDERLRLKGEISCSARVRGNRVVNVPQRSAGGSERRISRRVDVGVLLARFLADPAWRQRGRYYVANTLGHPLRALELEAHVAWAGFAPASRSSIGRMVAEARVEWSIRLEVAGLLDKG